MQNFNSIDSSTGFLHSDSEGVQPMATVRSGVQQAGASYARG
jgi:hypothetical protein